MFVLTAQAQDQNFEEKKKIQMIAIASKTPIWWRQTRALAFKAWSAQVRQWQMLVLVCLFPVLLILVCQIIANVMKDASKNLSGPSKDILMCSREDAMDPNLYYPITDLSNPFLPTTPANSVPHSSGPVTHINFLFFVNTASPTVSTSNSVKPCVYKFGKRYKTGTDVYSMDPGLSAKDRLFVSDSTFQAEPKGGWFGSNAIALLTKALMFGQMNEVFLVSAAEGVGMTLVGGESRHPWIGREDARFSITGKMVPPLGFWPVNESMALLDTVEQRVHLDVDAKQQMLTGFRIVPSFQPIGSSEEEMDQSLLRHVEDTFKRVSAVDTNILMRPNPPLSDILSFLTNASAAIQNMPFGGIRFTAANTTTAQYSYTLHLDDVALFSAVSAFPERGLRALLIQSQLSNAFLRFSSPKLKDALITQSLRAFPVLASTELLLPVDGRIGRVLYPFGVSFLVPLFVMMLVREKEAQVCVFIAAMNGVHPVLVALSHYTSFFLIYLLSATIFCVSGFVAKLQLFTRTSPFVLSVLLFLWGHVQVSASFLISLLFEQSCYASATSFLLILASVVASITIDDIFGAQAQIPDFLLAWPPFAYFRALSYLNECSFNPKLSPFLLHHLTGTDPITKCMYTLAIHAIVLQAAILASCYIRIPRLTFSNLRQAFKNRKLSPGAASTQRRISFLPGSLSFRLSANSLEDVDITEERKRVLMDVGLIEACPLVVRHLKKVYEVSVGGAQVSALKGVSFAVEQGCVFGLLGPNGAGKSTLLSILTGARKQTSGRVWMNGVDVSRDRRSIKSQIGICPQADLLWNTLSVQEHVLFYVRIKGVDPKDEHTAAQTLLGQVGLTHIAHRTPQHLSGGEKRRLSIAIALAGSPKLVFLDEPTAGLDPNIKRKIWAIIRSRREGPTIIMTTHSMQEAETCCTRLAILSTGRLKCLGSQVRLQQLHGAGMRLTVYLASVECEEGVHRFMEAVLPVHARRVDGGGKEGDLKCVYEFSPGDAGLGAVLREVEEGGGVVGIVDWTIAQAAMDSVFSKLVTLEET
ncbi:hypothetical protein HDU80_007174 [Chytriomyces hyalinus]|nr:hypothetical protein HDU80_007174 [Chytriomyces hyalinus]